MSRVVIDGNEYNNPLARFKSYSYYHVLAVCNSTETADAIASQTDGIVDTWLHPSMYNSSNGTTDLGRYSPKNFREDNRLQYCILINGATDAEYAITRASFQTMVAAAATNNDRFTSLAVEGRIDISEPKGVTFLDTIVRCCIAMGKDAAQVVYMLKTFFVGYNQNDEIETIATVVPLTFVLSDATGSFTEAGGSYTLEFVAAQNGASRMPQFDKMLKMPPIKGGTLNDVVTLMQQSIDDSYNKMFDCVQKQVAKTQPALVDSLRRVKYVVELADLYKSAEYTFNPSHQQMSDTGSCNDAAQISTGTDTSLESAMHQVMSHCAKVEQDSLTGSTADVSINGKTLPSGTKLGYKIHTSYESKVVRENVNNPAYVITYKVEPYPNPRDLVAADADTVKSVMEPNTIHFDYIYTGQNIDILNFDMKVNMGLAYLQTAVIRNTYKDQGEVTPVDSIIPQVKNINRAANRTKTDDNATVNVDIPVFFGTSLELPNKRTTSNPAATANMAYDMTKHSSVEILEANMKITGNLLLLHSAMLSTSLSAKPNTGYDANTLEGQQPMDWGFVPAYAKVNIRMPANNNDIGLFDSKTTSYAKDFWYKYYYYIMAVEHIFEDGDFVQNLEMIGTPEPLDVSDVSPNAKSTKDQFSIDVLDCYTNATASCGSNASGTGATTSNTDHDSNTVKNSQAMQHAVAQMPPEPIDKIVLQMSPDNVKGWSSGNPAVKEAIRQAAATGTNIPLSVFAAISAIESNGHPAAVSKTGAVGVFQFVSGTWNEVMPEYPTNSSMGANDPRRNPALSAEAAKRYANKISSALGGTVQPTWLYMGHNLGPRAAVSVMRSAAAGDTNKSMAQVYAEHPSWKPQWSQFASQNGYRQDSTVGNIRDQIAAKYSRYLKDINAAAEDNSNVPESLRRRPAVDGAPAPTVTGNSAAESANRASANCDSAASPEDKKPIPCGNKTPPTDTSAGVEAVKAATPTSNTTDMSNVGVPQYLQRPTYTPNNIS